MNPKPNHQLQTALDAIDANTSVDDIARAKCRALMIGYDTKYSSTEYQPTEVEAMTTALLLNPVTSRRSRLFSLAGKLDVVAEHKGRRVLIDHKTTSQDLGPDSIHWQQLTVEAQPSHYMLLKWINGEKLDTAIWDMVRKPSISPRKLSKAQRTAAIMESRYCNQQLSAETLELLKTEERETPEMYEARLVADCTKERPGWYFCRHSVLRLDSQLIEHAQELWDFGQEIKDARRTNRHPKNDGACLLYGSPCKFLGICSGYDTPDSDKWIRKANVHEELPELEGDGRNVLTNSRIRCFKMCRRKHFYSFELGITRQDEPEREVLSFGRLWHSAMEAWWDYLLPEPKEK